MTTVLVYLATCLAPCGAFVLLERAWRAWTGVTPWPAHPSRSTEPRPTHPPLERLALDLRRLGAELSRLQVSREPLRVRRMQAVSLAYDDTLRSCCAALGLPDPPRRPWRAADRLQVEADLLRAGLRW